MAAAQGLAPDPQVPELLSSKFDKPLVAYHNFLWVHHKVSNNGMVQFWRCNNHSSGCKARARSAFGTVNLGLTKEHDHHSVEAEIEVKLGALMTATIIALLCAHSCTFARLEASQTARDSANCSGTA